MKPSGCEREKESEKADCALLPAIVLPPLNRNSEEKERQRIRESDVRIATLHLFDSTSFSVHRSKMEQIRENRSRLHEFTCPFN